MERSVGVGGCWTGDDERDVGVAWGMTEVGGSGGGDGH